MSKGPSGLFSAVAMSLQGVISQARPGHKIREKILSEATDRAYTVQPNSAGVTEATKMLQEIIGGMLPQWTAAMGKGTSFPDFATVLTLAC